MYVLYHLNQNKLRERKDMIHTVSGEMRHIGRREAHL